MLHARCRHGHITTECPACAPVYGRFGQWSPAQSPTTAFNAQSKTYFSGSAAKSRKRGVPDHLFVCHDCYRAHRKGLPENPQHHACNQRLTLRHQELPIAR